MKSNEPGGNLFWKLVTSFINLNEAIVRFLTQIGAILTIALMVGISGAAISRYFFGRAIASMTEMSAYALLFITFLGAPLLAAHDGHISVDVVPNSLRPRQRTLMHAAINFLSCAIAFAIAWFAFITAQHSYANHEVTADILAAPEGFMFGLIALGAFFMGSGFLASGLKKMHDLFHIS